MAQEVSRGLDSGSNHRILINAFVAQATRVEGESMVQNLHNNERLIIEKMTYQVPHPPERRYRRRAPASRHRTTDKACGGLPGESI